MSSLNWSYGGVTYAVVDNVRHVRRHSHIGTNLLGLLLTVVAPLITAVWALAAFWPVSLFVWISVTVAFWAYAMSTAADENELAPN